MDPDFTAWQFRPEFDAGAAALSALAAYVAFDLARRFATETGRAAWLWLLGAALALGTGLASVHFVALAGRPLPFAFGYAGPRVAATVVLATLVALFVLWLAFAPQPTRRRTTFAALALGAVACAGPLLYLQALRVAPALHWQPLRVVAAALVSAALLAACLALARPAAPAWRRLLGALGTGLVVFGAQRATTLAAWVPFDAASLNHPGGLFGPTALAALASLGSASLLTAMLLLSLIEARMRAALQAAVARIEEAARTDALTQLPNRADFDRRLDAAARLADGADQMALLFIALDGFKPVNDSFGRSIGDQLLQQIARRLHDAAGAEGTVGRVGGDEFVLLLTQADRRSVGALAQRLLGRVGEPCEIEGRHVPVSCSIGIVLCPRDGAPGGAMVRAEAAARYAKRSGGATFAFFEPRMLGDAREQVELLRDLRQAVARQQLELYYQPLVHAPSGEVTGVEALLRWHHPDRGMVSPAVFVPIAERHGLIGTIGQWVIEEACRQAGAWRDAGLRMRVSINLSVHQLRQPDLAERIAAALQRHRVRPQLLTCEITESVAMEDAEGTMRIFERLAATGVQISIDDFGTGYSSLAYLRKLPAAELKIDRSFVLDLEGSADARAVVDAVVKLAQALGRKVVAEGVESEAQMDILRALGCDVLQGYLFAKPMSAKALAAWAMNDVGPREIDFRASLFAETTPAPLH